MSKQFAPKRKDFK